MTDGEGAREGAPRAYDLRSITRTVSTETPARTSRVLRATSLPPVGSSAQALDGSGQRARLLLVDDDEDIRNYLRRLLSRRWDVDLAEDGAVALELARGRRPDLVLTDVMMPGLDGFELLRELRADARLRDVPVVMLSARAGEEARLASVRAGVDDYLVKPFSASELIARVDAQLARAKVRAIEGARVSASTRGEGRGSALEVRIAAASGTKHGGYASIDRSSDAPAISARRVLIVDDNQDAAVLLGESLARIGYVTRIAHDGPAAMQVAAQFEPELALLDMGLPVMDGYELARRLRELPRPPRRLIAVTRYGRESDRVRSDDAGFAAHLVKPVDLPALLALLAAATEAADS